MGTFTQLADRDVASLASAFALGEVVAWSPIAAGTINSNFRVETIRNSDHPHADTSSWFLRVNEGKSEDDVAYEAKLVEAFAAGGVPTPSPIGARDGRRYAALGDKWVSAFPWRAGVHLAATEVTPAAARKLGAALAQLHVTGLALPATWQRASIYDHAHLVARYRRFERDSDPELARAISILGEELAEAERASAIRTTATHGIIHGDLFRDNVLWAAGPGEGEASPVVVLGGEGEGRARARAQNIVAILDFEQASGGSLSYDLAVCINDWCWLPAGPRFDLVAALLDGYRAVRSLPEVDRAALIIEVRAAAARFTITRITDVYLARVTNPEKDFRAFLARSEAWRGPALGQLSSLL